MRPVEEGVNYVDDGVVPSPCWTLNEMITSWFFGPPGSGKHSLNLGTVAVQYC